MGGGVPQPQRPSTPWPSKPITRTPQGQGQHRCEAVRRKLYPTGGPTRTTGWRARRGGRDHLVWAVAIRWAGPSTSSQPSTNSVSPLCPNRTYPKQYPPPRDPTFNMLSIFSLTAAEKTSYPKNRNHIFCANVMRFAPCCTFLRQKNCTCHGF